MNCVFLCLNFLGCLFRSRLQSIIGLLQLIYLLEASINEILDFSSLMLPRVLFLLEVGLVGVKPRVLTREGHALQLIEVYGQSSRILFRQESLQGVLALFQVQLQLIGVHIRIDHSMFLHQRVVYSADALTFIGHHLALRRQLAVRDHRTLNAIPHLLKCDQILLYLLNVLLSRPLLHHLCKILELLVKDLEFLVDFKVLVSFPHVAS